MSWYFRGIELLKSVFQIDRHQLSRPVFGHISILTSLTAHFMVGKKMFTRPRIAPLSFALIRTGPKNSKFYGPDPGPTRLYFPSTGPKQFSINPKLTSFDPDRPENSEVRKIFCVEIKDLRFKSSFRLQ